ncbi:putative methyltransferase [Desulforapulum autotrophicum HRM2]|jgi:SAM-dependent methyltransferase|uniref:Methyltransferase n=1 Tax=Desulforapulum autotrophicum (strain ATCC 43914 / DSM 3382 / VKM B-1955 / HRM2) TaxID=177437 RepID=C0QIF0_DESAH|nr:methyltransferase domain-containing protein [Desulforapulum autotrophicum]ACN17894.1 putative methyltransferase [Desulforapulum autotrophicum HRM2]
MKTMTLCDNAYDTMDFSIDITWERHGIHHRESYFADHMNCWRDIFPGSVLEAIMTAAPGQTIVRPIPPGHIIPDYRPDKVLTLPLSRLNNFSSLEVPDLGRFYPQGIISGLPGVFSDNLIPFRCIGLYQDLATVDLNHPMAGIPMEVTMTVHTRSPGSGERGGSCTDWIDLALTGPGMQSRHDLIPTRFSSTNRFHRKDARPDPLFYETDRFVHHIDQTARKNLSKLYATLIRPGDAVLDLMASWESHIPEELSCSRVHGIGLNANELRQNPRLTGYGVQDLNIDPILLFDDHTFDAVICSLSVEYLTDPVTVFNQVARVLKPGGTFALSFSNRWFPEKAVNVWTDLHDFERMGLVLEYFFESNRYTALSTVSLRGYPRPEHDDYSSTLKLSDPLYVVVGKTRR